MFGVDLAQITQRLAHSALGHQVQSRVIAPLRAWTQACGLDLGLECAIPISTCLGLEGIQRVAIERYEPCPVRREKGNHRVGLLVLMEVSKREDEPHQR
jgi:hypothetical protein